MGWTSLLLDELEGAGDCEAFDAHPTPDLSIVAATAGAHRLEISRRGEWRAAWYRAGATGLSAGGESNRLRWRTIEGQRFRTAHLYLPAALIEETAEEYRRAGAPHVARPLSALVFRDPLMTTTIAALLDAIREGRADLYAEQAARWLAAHLLGNHGRCWDPATDTRSAGVLDDRRLARVVEYMSEHLDEPLSLGRLAREAGISVHHFGRLFRERVGRTPHAYLTGMRMGLARRLLQTTDLGVGEVAEACGYTNAAAFATAFLREHGVSPTRFRRLA